MMLLTATFVLAILGAITNAKVQKCECGIENLKTRIIDGHVAESGRYPWMTSVLIQSGNTISSCGGSLINDRYILTAAHCVKDLKSISQLKVAMDVHTSKERQLTKHLKVEKVIAHPDWKSFDDIALIKLAEPVANPVPVCLPTFTDYNNLFVTGWGLTGKSGNKKLTMANELMEVDIDEVEINECKRKYFPQINTEKEICAGGKVGGSCMGDSGGPLQTRKNGRVYQAGIVSFGATDCATITNAPNVYESVVGQLEWIKENTEDAVWCNGPEQPDFVTGKTSQKEEATRPTQRPTVPTQRPKTPTQRPGTPTQRPSATRPSSQERRPSVASIEDDMVRSMFAPPPMMMPPMLSSPSWTSITSRPGMKVQVITSSSSGGDPFKEMERMMERSGLRSMMKPMNLGNDLTSRITVRYPDSIISRGGSRIVSSSSSSNSYSSNGFGDLGEQFNRIFN